jgi:hypothetical protein
MLAVEKECCSVILVEVKHEALMGFDRASSPVRCAHPSVQVHYHLKRSAAPPPDHRSFAASLLVTFEKI